MSRLRWLLLGILATLAAEALAAAVFLKTAGGFSANAAPSAVERWAARRARALAVPAGAKSASNPEADTPENLAVARAHWADHCASCHANDGSGSEMGKKMYPPALDMRLPDTQKLTDGELFYIIENGVRLTGMPAWSGHEPADSWKLVRFIRRLPDLTLEERKEMEKLNPKGPAEWKEQEEEEKFLRGETNEVSPQHHH